MIRIDKNIIPIDTSEVRAIFVIRNEAPRIEWLISYYRKLGVHRFFVVDNDSSDNLQPILNDYQDIHVFFTNESFRENKTQWINYLLNEFCSGNWSLILDADEVFVFPYSEHIKVKELCNYLDDRQMQGIFSPLLDMYSGLTLEKVNYISGTPFFDYCPYFDSSGYFFRREANHPSRVLLYGGPRRRIFFTNENNKSDRTITGPLLSKITLIKWIKGLNFEIHGVSDIKLADVTGALLHYKFFNELRHRARIEATRGEYWNDAIEYKAYAQCLENNPKLSLKTFTSRRYRSSFSLLRYGIIHTSPEWDYFAFNKMPKLFSIISYLPKKGCLGTFIDKSSTYLRKMIKSRAWCTWPHPSVINQISTITTEKRSDN